MYVLYKNVFFCDKSAVYNYNAVVLKEKYTEKEYIGQVLPKAVLRCKILNKHGIRKCVDKNAHISVDPKVYAEKYEFLADRYAKAKDKLDKTETEIANRNSRKNMIAAFLDELEKQEHLITDFDTGLWNAVIESMTIYSKEHIVFKFKGGTEIKWSVV